MLIINLIATALLIASLASGYRFSRPRAPVQHSPPAVLATDDKISARVVIPKLGVDAPIVELNRVTDLEVAQALERGVGHFPGTALPGMAGNSYLFGHSSDHPWSAGEYKSVFARLPELGPGDQVIVTNNPQQPFKYLVVSTTVVDPADMSVLRQFGHRQCWLTLQTSYPIGSAKQRFIVRAKLQPDPGFGVCKAN